MPNQGSEPLRHVLADVSSIQSTEEYFGIDLDAMAHADNYHRWILARFQPYLGRTVAEVGAGIGTFTTLVAGTQADEIYAFEPSSNMYPLLADFCRNLPRVKAVNSFFDHRQGGFLNYFDSVLYVNVMEHVQDAAGEMRIVQQTLKPGGYLCLFVPALAFLYSDFDRKLGHFRRFHRAELVTLVEASGFQVVEASYFDFFGILPWYIRFKLMKQTLSARNVKLYDRLVVPIAQRLEQLVRPPLGKNLLLVARKAQ